MDVKVEDGKLVVTVPVSDEDGVRKLVGALGLNTVLTALLGLKPERPSRFSGATPDCSRIPTREGVILPLAKEPLRPMLNRRNCQLRMEAAECRINQGYSGTTADGVRQSHGRSAVSSRKPCVASTWQATCAVNEGFRLRG